MWCTHCQSDVPQIAESPAAPRRCGRCGRFATASHSAAENRPIEETARGFNIDFAISSLVEPALYHTSTWDDWTLAAEVRCARRRLSDARGVGSIQPWRLVDNHAKSLAAVDELVASPFGSRSQTRRRIPRFRRILWLLALLVGLLAFGCGAVMATFDLNRFASINHSDTLLMQVGLFGLLGSVLLGLMGLGRDIRALFDRLRLVELRLQEYRQAAILTARDDGVRGAAPGSAPRPSRV